MKNIILTKVNEANLSTGLMGGLISAIAITENIAIMFEFITLFITMDFITGIIADIKRKRRECKKWYFQSAKAWDSIYKLIFSMIGVYLASKLDAHIFSFINLNLAQIITGFICGVEFWSFLENAAVISNHKIFRLIKEITKKKIKKIDQDLSDTLDEDEKLKNK